MLCVYQMCQKKNQNSRELQNSDGRGSRRERRAGPGRAGLGWARPGQAALICGSPCLRCHYQRGATCWLVGSWKPFGCSLSWRRASYAKKRKNPTKINNEYEGNMRNEGFLFSEAALASCFRRASGWNPFWQRLQPLPWLFVWHSMKKVLHNYCKGTKMRIEYHTLMWLTLIVAIIVKCVCFMARFSRERLEKQFYLHFEAPPVCAKWQGMEVNSGAEGGEA